MNLTIKKSLEKRFGVRIYRQSLPRGCDLFHDLRPILSRVKTIFDVGANVGDFTCEAAGYCPGAVIHAFEPVASTCATLRQRLSGLPSVQVHQCAFDAESGQKEITLLEDSRMNSLLSSETPRSRIVGRETVKTWTLDQFAADAGIPSIDLLKVDTEGADLRVLEGARKMLATGSIKLIQVESGAGADNLTHISFERFRDYLAPLNFSVFGIYHQTPAFDSLALRYFDIVFIHASILK